MDLGGARPVRALRSACRSRIFRAPGPSRGSARAASRVSRASGRGTGAGFVAADPGISTARADFGFRSLNDVDKSSDPQTGKIVSRWLGRFVLESGAILPDLVVAYRHDGFRSVRGARFLVVHA